MIIDRATTQTLYFWLIGGFVNRTWLEVGYLWPWVAGGMVPSFLSYRILDVLAFGDTMARSLGGQTVRWRLGLGLVSVILAAACVAVAGPIGFIGFLAPHLARVTLGDAALSHAVLLPFAGAIGAVLTLFADRLSRTIPVGNGTPAGVFIAVFGGVLFLILSRRVIRRTT